jgi:hypothetical protein
MRRSLTGSLTALLLAAALSSCGAGARTASSGSADDAVRVGGLRIGASLISHWASLIARGAVLPGPDGTAADTASTHALRFLIWSAWVSQDAEQRGVAVSDAEVSRALAAEQAGFPSRAEFETFLKANGETIADAKLALRTALAAAAIERMAPAGAVATRSEVASYYARHHSQFTRDETRYFDIVNALPFAKAQELVRRSRLDHSFPHESLHESLTRSHMLHTTADKRAIERAIFAAVRGVAAGPVKLFKGYSIFIVRRITPKALHPLGAVKAQIEARITAHKRRRAFARFVRGWTGAWKARTSCARGYVIDMCRQSNATPDVQEALAKARAFAEAADASSRGQSS